MYLLLSADQLIVDPTEETITIRPLVASVDEVSSLMASSIRATYPDDIVDVIVAHSADQERVARNMTTRTWFEARLGAGVLVGVGAVHLTDASTAYLSSHNVVFRRHGIGKRLTAARLDWARAQGATTAVATTHPWNTASLANLASFGFQVVSESDDLWSPPGKLLELHAPL